MKFAPKAEPAPGMLLVAAANLHDPNFVRTVILLCEHQNEGTFGLVLNSVLPVQMSDVVEDLNGWDAPLYKGGPVQENTLHFLHCNANIGIGSNEILPGVFWGGDFDRLNDLLESRKANPDDFRFYVGYSGWGEGQLATEIERESWYLTTATRELVFCRDERNQWRMTLASMGSEYKMLSNFPDDPSLN